MQAISHVYAHLQQHCRLILMRERPRQLRVPPETKRNHRTYNPQQNVPRRANPSHNEGMGGFLHLCVDALVHVQRPFSITTGYRHVTHFEECTSSLSSPSLAFLSSLTDAARNGMGHTRGHAATRLQ